MSVQSDLFGGTWVAAHQEAFDRLHAKDPRLYEMFRMFTLELIAAGVRHSGAELIVNRIRWETTLRAGNDHYKVNSKFRKPLALKFIEEFPQHIDFFEFRDFGEMGMSYDERLMNDFGPGKTSQPKRK